MPKKEKWSRQFDQGRMMRERGLKEYANAFTISEQSLVQKVEQSRVTIDIGCGIGRFIREMSFCLHQNSANTRLIGIDFLTDHQTGENWQIMPGKFHRLPISDEEADLVISVAGFGTYADNEQQFTKQIGEIHRVMAIHGELWFTAIPAGITPREHWLTADEVSIEERLYDQQTLEAKEVTLIKPKHYNKLTHPKRRSLARLDTFLDWGFEPILRQRVVDDQSTLGMINLRLRKIV